MTANAGDKAKQTPGKVQQAGDKAEQVGNSKSLVAVARVGLIAYGAVHVLIAWLALQIARGLSGRESADTSGAMKTLADQPFGQVLLWLVAVGLAALALWQASAVIWGYRNLEGAERVRKQITNGAKAVVFAALGCSAGAAALGAGSSSAQCAPRGALLYPRRSREGLGGRFLGRLADLDPKGEGDRSMPEDPAAGPSGQGRRAGRTA